MERAVWALTDEELPEALRDAWVWEQKWAARRLELVREVEGRGLARRAGCTSTTAWLNAVLRVNAGAARRMLATAQVLDTSCAATAKALAQGAVNEAQASVIGRCIEGLADCGAAVQSAVEQILLEAADTLDPHALGMLSDHALRQADPEAAEQRQRRSLDEAERRAARDRFFTLSPDESGRTRLSGVLGAEAAAVVAAAMGPLCRPAGKDDDRSPGQRRADALTDICALALANGDLANSGGEKAQVVVTTSFDTLRQDLGVGCLDTGATVSAAVVRRLACDAGIIPAVLAGTGQPLDLGRQRRLFAGALRRALALRDGGCAFPGCDRPPKWTDGHHIQHWSEGGRTCLANGVLLCGHHHRVIHHSEWTVRLAPDGMPEFVPPPHVDPHRTPKRNHFHRRH